MIAKSGIDRSKFKVAIITKVVDLFRYFFLLKPTMGCEGASHPNHDFAMSFFNNEKWVDFGQKIVQGFAGDLSVINRALFFRDACSALLLVVCGFGFFFDPIHQPFISVRNFYVGVIVEKVFCGFCSKKPDEKATFTIDDSCKISQFSISHIHPFVYDYTIYNKSELFVQPERLSPWDTGNGICDSLNSTNKKRWRERSEEVSPPCKTALHGHKSNRVPVLNSAAARLGQSLRETQDALQRDNLESSASIINCVGGTDGDIPTEMTVSDVNDVFTVLQNNSGEYITNIVEADLKFGTSPIGDAYGCMLTTRMIPVLYNMPQFVKKFQYPNINQTLSVELGGVNNVRFFVSEQGSVSAGASLLGNDVANCFVAAKEAYKVVWQAGGKARFIYLPPGYNNDPCMLRHTAGCSFYQGQCITNDLWIQNLRSTGI